MIARAILVVAMAGCAPQLSQLVEHHHYREAVCAAHDGSASDRTRVSRSIARDANAHLHVEMVQPPHLENVLGPGDTLNAVARFARVRLQLDVIPVDRVDATIELRDAKGERAAVPVAPMTLATMTGEPLPLPIQHATYLHSGTFWRVLGAVATVGLSLPFTRFTQRVYAVEPPGEAYRAEAPRAYELWLAMPNRGCTVVPSRIGTKSQGLSCEWFIAILALPATSVKLDVTLAYSANRLRGDACDLSETTSIPLGRVDELALVTSRRFGARMRRL